MQAQIEIGNFAWVSSFVIDGAIGVDAGDAIDHATSLCRSDAQKAGITDTGGVNAWLSTSTDDAGRMPTRTPDRS